MHVLNINQRHNEALMNACQPLREYAAYTAKVRENIKAGYPVKRGCGAGGDRMHPGGNPGGISAPESIGGDESEYLMNMMRRGI